MGTPLLGPSVSSKLSPSKLHKALYMLPLPTFASAKASSVHGERPSRPCGLEFARSLKASHSVGSSCSMFLILA